MILSFHDHFKKKKSYEDFNLYLMFKSPIVWHRCCTHLLNLHDNVTSFLSDSDVRCTESRSREGRSGITIPENCARSSPNKRPVFRTKRKIVPAHAMKAYVGVEV